MDDKPDDETSDELEEDEFAEDDDSDQEAAERIRELEASGGDFLSLAHLGLVELPPSIGRLTNLRVLRCEGNGLNELPNELGNLRNLQTLSLNQNYFRRFPKVILKLTSLEVVFLGWNQLQTIPDEIANLTRLKYLVLNSNEIERLPDSIGRLQELLGLEVGRNPLVDLPPAIGELSKLEKLVCDNTEISLIPRAVASLPKLREVYLDDNLRLPPELLRLAKVRGWPAARKYLLGELDEDAARFRSIEDFKLPSDFTAYLESAAPHAFEFDEAKNFGYPPFCMVAKSDLRVEWLKVVPFDGGPGGPWHLPAVNLIFQAGQSQSPINAFLWLPDHRRYATFDFESENLFVFHESTTWTRIAADFRTHFLATNSGCDPDPAFAVRYEESSCFSSEHN